MTNLHGHTSFETAYEVTNYPYGFKLRTSIFYWIETVPRKGDRFCSATINPKNGRLNAANKSTFSVIGFMFLNEDNHVKWDCVGQYENREKVLAFGEKMGVNNMNPEQKKQYNSMLGINEGKTNEFTGESKADYAIKWEKDKAGQLIGLKITFARPDGVKLKEVFEAMKAVNQNKLNEVYEVRDYGRLGSFKGVVRLCVRGGAQLGTIAENDYREFLASDYNTVKTYAENE